MAEAVPTRMACLTPAGKAAVATLAVHGPDAWDLTRSLFRPRRGALPEIPAPGGVWVGQLGDAVRDEVVLCVRRSDPDAWLEVHCHGGPAVVALIEELYGGLGVRACSPHELARSTLDPPWRTAAAEWLVQAPTARTAGILLDQYAGAFHDAVEAVRSALLVGDAATAQGRLDRLAGHAPLGRHLVHPWSVVIAGAPNVGKSSLVNALAGYTRSIVAATAGTTRDVVKAALAIDGWPVELCDTAGLRDAAGEIESEGISRARMAVTAADLCLWILDGAAPPVFPAADGIAWQLVVNKTDCPAGWDWSRAGDAPHVSALTRAGLDELCAALARRLVADPPAPGEAVPFSPALCEAVEQAAWRLRDNQFAAADLGALETAYSASSP